MKRHPVAVAVLAAVALLPGCAFGPKALHKSQPLYNEAVKCAAEEQLLLNLVRVRYNEPAQRLDVAAIAAQYEVAAQAEARPFFSTEATGDAFRSFASVLPFLGASAANRPTVSLNPLDDPETIRGLFTPGSLDAIIFLAESSWPLDAMFQMWVEYANHVPNAVTASGPPRALVPEFAEFQQAARLLQQLHDRGGLRFVREERALEIGSPLPESAVTAAAQVEAAKGGFEYRQRPDKTWALARHDRKLTLRIDSQFVNDPDVREFCRLLNLKPGEISYDVAVGAEGPLADGRAAPGTTLRLLPRSPVQASFYLSHGIDVPAEHLQRGLVRPTVGADGAVFDWRCVTEGLFAVHSVKSHHPPKNAYVAVRYRDYWYYIDDRDVESKQTFSLLLYMTRANLLGVRKGGPMLTLPVGR